MGSKKNRKLEYKQNGQTRLWKLIQLDPDRNPSVTDPCTSRGLYGGRSYGILLRI
jgi:hypothetical protein